MQFNSRCKIALAFFLILSGNAFAACDSYTKVMLHMDDTGLTDSSSAARTMTLVGNTARSSTQSKFGGYSALYDGTGDRLTAPDAADLELGSGDFTFDAWIRINTLKHFGIANKFSGTNRSWQIFYLNTSHTLNLDWTTDGTHTLGPVSASWTPSTNTWYHIEVDKSGTNVYFFVNGTQVGATQTVSGAFYDGTALFGVGNDDSSGSSLDFDGYMDEARLSVGIARHTANFSVATSAYCATTSTACFLGDML